MTLFPALERVNLTSPQEVRIMTITALAPVSSAQLDGVHLEFRSVLRAFVRDQVLPLVDESEKSKSFPKQLWSKLAGLGVLGIGLPEHSGGTGDADSVSMMIFAEELSKASGGIAITPLASSYLGGPYLAKFGTPDQQKTYLEPMIAGKMVAAIAITEPGAGSDVAGISSVARKVEGGYRISGSKIFITNGGIADWLIVAAKTDPTERHKGISQFIVLPSDLGFSVGRPLEKLGWHSSDTRELRFDDCFVPDDRLVGEVGRGFYQIASAFQTERLVLCGMALGHAQVCLDLSLEYAKQRVAFGHTIGKFQAIRHQLAQMAIDLKTSRLLALDAAHKLDAHAHDSLEVVSMAKYHCCRVANTIADHAMQVFGGMGYLEETKIALHFRDARILRIGGGTDEIMLEVVAKQMGL